ncbi:MAG: outer membrane protein transport protein [Bacteroidetes bacterium]|nr:outer membrane protein transport protein [Bacteroidota bacterium]
MNNFKKYLSSAAIIILMMIFTNSSINATNGYFRHGYGVKYSAMAGAGVALSLSSIGAATNPAGIVFIDGTRFDINVALFSPSRSYTIDGNPSMYPGTFPLTPGKVESESNYFPMPTMGASFKIQDNMSLGLIFYANGGMNSDYPAVTYYHPMAPEVSPATGVNLEQMFFGATFAMEVAPNHSLGVTGLFGFQRFAAKGLTAFMGFSSSPMNLTGNRWSTSTGFGARLGYMGKFSDVISFGASYQTKMSMSEFDEYAGLFAEQGKFDIPANWTVGVAISPNTDWTFALDGQQILYTGVASVANPMSLMTNSPMDQQGNPNPNFKALGTNEAWGFGWEDVMVIKFGTMFNGFEGWTFMAGYSYGKQPINETEVMFNILAPAVVEHHITFGATKQLSNGKEVTLGFMFAPEGEVTGANPMEAPGAQNITIAMSQWQLELGFSF